MDEDEGLTVVVEAEGEGDVYAELGAEVAVSNGLWDTAAGAVVELGDGSATGAFLGFVHFGFLSWDTDQANRGRCEDLTD